MAFASFSIVVIPYPGFQRLLMCGFGPVSSDWREKGSFFLAALAKSFGRPKHPAAREKNTSGTQQVVVFL